MAVNGTSVLSGVASQPITLGLQAPTAVDVAFVSSSGTVHYSLTVPPQQEGYFKASNTPVTAAGGRFGRGLALDGDTLVVGAPNESSGGKGIGGDQNGLPAAPAAGAVYVFTRSGNGWQQQAYLKASTPHAGDQFGFSVALSGDTLAVGAVTESSNATGIDGNQADTSAAGSGAVFVFTRAGSTWTQQAYIKASNTRAGAEFGKVLALDGTTLVVGSAAETSNAVGINGNQADVSIDGAGAASVFTRAGSTWSQQAYLKASNNSAPGMAFGSSVAISGDSLVVGALNERSSAVGVNGNAADTSTQGAGAAYVFARSGSTWSQQAYVKASNTRANAFFGYSVALHKDTLAVGAIRDSSGASGVNGNQIDTSTAAAGAVYVFTRTAATWAQQAYVKASNNAVDLVFGTALAVRNDTLAIGATHESSKGSGINGLQSDASMTWAGSAYLFGRSGSTWTQHAYLKASNPVADAQFGSSVVLTDDTLAIGAVREPSKASGINGGQADTSLVGAGAVYVLR